MAKYSDSYEEERTARTEAVQRAFRSASIELGMFGQPKPLPPPMRVVHKGAGLYYEHLENEYCVYCDPNAKWWQKLIFYLKNPDNNG